MAATKNTLAALWGKRVQHDRRTKSDDHGSVISTRSKAAEEKEKEATSRLAKGDIERPLAPLHTVDLTKQHEKASPEPSLPQVPLTALPPFPPMAPKVI